MKIRVSNKPGESWRPIGPGRVIHTAFGGAGIGGPIQSRTVRALRNAEASETSYTSSVLLDPPSDHRLTDKTIRAARELSEYGTGRSRAIAIEVLRSGSVVDAAAALRITTVRVYQALGLTRSTGSKANA